MPSFDPAAVRAEFPILSREVEGKVLVYLDNGATSQKPRRVIDATANFYRDENANIHRGVHYLSRMATDAYDDSRVAIARRLGLPADHELVFVRGTTEAINLVAHGLGESLREGDEIVLTLMEHHANFVPWQVLAERRGLVLRFVPPRDNGELDLEAWKEAFGPRTRLAAFTHVSNVLGTVNPVREMSEFAKERDVLALVDGAQALPHGPVDVGGIGCDFYTFSGHKIFGPDGVGVLTGPKALLDSFPPYQTGGDMIERVSVSGTTFRDGPERFEAGTPNISGAIGLREAFRWHDGIDWKAAARHEEALRGRLESELEDMGGVRIFGKAPGKAAVVSFLMDCAHSHDVATILDSEGVAVRAGHHCAQPLMEHLGVAATARASFALYNNDEDIDILLAALRKVKRYFE